MVKLLLDFEIVSHFSNILDNEITTLYYSWLAHSLDLRRFWAKKNPREPDNPRR
jgi:hypothetical protein